MGVNSSPVDHVTSLLRDLGEVSVLTRDEEHELALRKEAGDDQASEELVRRNIRLVISIAKRYTHRGLEMADLIQEGTIGLMRAVEKFDPHQGYKFSSYAIHWIRQAITLALKNQTKTIRLPVHIHDSLRELAQAKHNLTLNGDVDTGSLDDEELLQELEMKPAKLASLSSLPSCVSLDAPSKKNGSSFGVDRKGATLGELIPDDDGLELEDLFAVRDEIRQLLVLLWLDRRSSVRDKGIFRLREGLYPGGERLALEKVGQHFDLTRQRVMQIVYDKIWPRLQRSLTNENGAIYPPRALAFLRAQPGGEQGLEGPGAPKELNEDPVFQAVSKGYFVVATEFIRAPFDDDSKEDRITAAVAGLEGRLMALFDTLKAKKSRSRAVRLAGSIQQDITEIRRATGC